MPPDRVEMRSLIAEAYEHLYDLVFLRTHPLRGMLVRDPSLNPNDAAWQLHHTLLNALQELDPGPKAPAYSREWRRHRLLVLRYVDGWDLAATASELAISRRSYFREHEAALDALTTILEARCSPQGDAGAPPPQAGNASAASNRELVRLEAARLVQAERYTHLAECVQGAVQLVQEMARQGDVQLRVALDPDLPTTGMQHAILRQILLSLLSFLIKGWRGGHVQVSAALEGDHPRITLRAFGPGLAAALAASDEDALPLANVQELAAMQEVQLQPVRDGDVTTGFDLVLPSAHPRSVLVVDDNEDALNLFQRYLTLHRYRALTARTGEEALSLARQQQPYAITLDLMMPDTDGWDILQTLTNQPATRDIPVIVCSVLAAKDLALSLGAAAFLAKPVTEQSLLAALQALEEA